MSKRILIAYYSWSGNTRAVAKQVQALVNGTLFEIRPDTPYPSDYNACTKQAKKEINEGYRPVLAEGCGNMDIYDIVLIGTPNWWSSIAPPVATFLSENDLSGKIIAPFYTHGGGGAGRIEKDIFKLCGNASVLEGLCVQGNGGRNANSQIDGWLERMNIR